MPIFHVHNMRGVIPVLSHRFSVLHLREHSQPYAVLHL